MTESQTTEFKRIWQDDYLKTICAFANTQGGSLYVGLDDLGEVVGIDNLNLLLETLPNKINNRLGVIVDIKAHCQLAFDAHAKIGRFLSPTELITSDIIEGNLFQQLEQVIDVLRAKYLKSYISYDGLNRIETLEYPYEAIREAVINALIHRDYTDTTVLQIRVYDERLVMSNGATLSHEVPIEKFNQEHASKPFNPLIANVFYKAGFVESWGKGTNNIVQECLNMGLPEPRYEYSFHSVNVTFYKAQETAQETAQEKTAERLIALITENPHITRKDMVTKLNKADGTIKQHLDNLKKSGVLVRIGSNKSGYWQIIERLK